MKRSHTRRPLRLVAVAATLLAAACTGPDSGNAQNGGAGGGGGGGASGSASAEPVGREVTTTSEFDSEPCAAASATEISDALRDPFNTIAAELLVPDGPPAGITGDDVGEGGSAGCEYRLVAEGTDSSEAYHMITVRVVRLDSGGPELLRACRDAAGKDPMHHRVLDLADGACVGDGAVLALLVGSAHYSVTAAAIPGRADQTDEDLRLGTLSEAAGTVLAERLPSR